MGNLLSTIFPKKEEASASSEVKKSDLKKKQNFRKLVKNQRIVIGEPLKDTFTHCNHIGADDVKRGETINKEVFCEISQALHDNSNPELAEQDKKEKNTVKPTPNAPAKSEQNPQDKDLPKISSPPTEEEKLSTPNIDKEIPATPTSQSQQPEEQLTKKEEEENPLQEQQNSVEPPVLQETKLKQEEEEEVQQELQQKEPQENENKNLQQHQNELPEDIVNNPLENQRHNNEDSNPIIKPEEDKIEMNIDNNDEEINNLNTKVTQDNNNEINSNVNKDNTPNEQENDENDEISTNADNNDTKIKQEIEDIINQINNYEEDIILDDPEKLNDNANKEEIVEDEK